MPCKGRLDYLGVIWFEIQWGFSPIYELRSVESNAAWIRLEGRSGTMRVRRKKEMLMLHGYTRR
jgi:hypothetical protein